MRWPWTKQADTVDELWRHLIGIECELGIDGLSKQGHGVRRISDRVRDLERLPTARREAAALRPPFDPIPIHAGPRHRCALDELEVFADRYGRCIGCGDVWGHLGDSTLMQRLGRSF
jgi:hypothetical protein